MAPQQQETAMIFTSITIAVVVPLIVSKLFLRFDNGVIVGAAVGIEVGVGAGGGTDDRTVLGVLVGSEVGAIVGEEVGP